MAAQSLTQVPSAFSYHQSAIHVIADEHGEPWFQANEVCTVLDYKNPRDAISKHCRQKGVAKRDTLTPKGKQEATFINEGNLYRLIIKSRKPEAEPFEKWVCDEVLPAIRKTGTYTQVITPAQQNALQQIAKRKVESEGGMYRYYWGQFNNHFELGSYKQLPAARFDEAAAYLAQITPKAEQPHADARQAAQALAGTRWLLSFDRRGQKMTPLGADDFMISAQDIATLVRTPDYPRRLLPELLAAVGERMKGDAAWK